jgi:dynactin 1
VFSTKAHPVNETDPFSTMLARLSALTPSLVELSAFVGDLDNTFEFEKPTPPWVLRSKELAAAKVVSVDAEEEIRRLKEDIQAGKRELRTKIQDLEERDVKIEVLEKRVGDAAKKASRIKELEGITKENRETITRMQQSLQEKLDETERLMAERDRAVAAADEYLKRSGDPNAKKGEVEMSGASKREVERLKSEIGVLERTNKFLRETNRREQRARDAAADSWLRAPLTRSFGPPPSSKRSSGVPSDQGVSDPRLALADLTNLPHAARLVDLTTLLQDGEGGEEKSKRRLRWQPKKLTPQYVLEEQEGRWAEIWGGWEARGWGAAGPVGVMG